MGFTKNQVEAQSPGIRDRNVCRLMQLVRVMEFLKDRLTHKKNLENVCLYAEKCLWES